MTPKELLKSLKEEAVEFVDLKFTDLFGAWQHFSVPATKLEESVFESGFGFDGSSLRGWQQIEASDMLVRPDASSARRDPFLPGTLSLLCDVFDPISGRPYTRDPRHIARKAEAYLAKTGLADKAYFGPEAEFFLFDDVRYEQTPNSAFYALDSRDGHWNTGTDERPNLGYKPRYKEGYFPVLPTDDTALIRHDMVRELIKLGIDVECDHHEVATAGQCEIDIKYGTLLDVADNLLWFKYVVKNVARRYGKTATFMPKPLLGDNGSGMHTHISLWKGGEPLFAGQDYAGLSEMARHFIGGILVHAPALVALTNPTLNSYKRLVPGFEAPVKLTYSSRNRSAAVRIPMYSDAPAAKRIEFRTPDPTCNPYLAFAAMLMAGLDGVEKRMDPGKPSDRNLYEASDEISAQIRSVPADLNSALTALQDDHAFLLRGEVFTEDVISTWIEYKFTNEVQQSRQRPTPLEFELYFDA